MCIITKWESKFRETCLFLNDFSNCEQVDITNNVTKNWLNLFVIFTLSMLLHSLACSMNYTLYQITHSNIYSSVYTSIGLWICAKILFYLSISFYLYIIQKFKIALIWRYSYLLIYTPRLRTTIHPYFVKKWKINN